jgi:hypothetical protein
MGQYHLLVNSDKKEYINPRDLGFGAKQLEHIGFLGDLPLVQYLLTTCSRARGFGDFSLTEYNEAFLGRWAGDRVFVLGDYTEQGDVPKVRSAHTFWKKIHAKESEWTNISELAQVALENNEDLKMLESVE